jgi:hypothetical protein
VLAAFSSATYLLTDEAELFWIVPDGAPMHRRALRVSSSLAGLREGSSFQVEGQSLAIDPGVTSDMSRAFVWRVTGTDYGGLVEIARILPRVRDLFSRLDLSGAQGFGRFIPGLLQFSRGAPTGPTPKSSDPVLAFARPLVMDVAGACRENQPCLILRRASALIGLGAGLTPSGDDFVGGMLFAVKALQDVYHFQGSLDDLFDLAPFEAQTHPISFTLLQDLARGHAVAPLHQLLTGILNAEPFDFVQRSFSRLTRLGHSTGWDLLAGMVTGLLITAAGRDRVSASPANQSAWT